MQFLKILFVCLAAFVAAAFTIGNWFSVPIRLPGGLVAETNLPLLLLVAFLAGLLPTWAAARLRRWRLRQRLSAAERRLAEMLAIDHAPAAASYPAHVVTEPVHVAPPPAGTSTSPVAADAESATGPGGLL